MLTITSGFILTRQPYDNVDEIVTVLTNEKILKLFSRGSRKVLSKNGRALQLFAKAELEYFPARLNTSVSRLKTARAVFTLPINEPLVAKACLELATITRKIDTFSPKLLQALKAVSAFWDAQNANYISTFLAFNALESLGLSPHTDACVVCFKRTQISDFSFAQGGFLCSEHATKRLALAELKAYVALSKSFTTYVSTTPSINERIKAALYRFLVISGF